MNSKKPNVSAEAGLASWKSAGFSSRPRPQMPQAWPGNDATPPSRQKASAGRRGARRARGGGLEQCHYCAISVGGQLMTTAVAAASCCIITARYQPKATIHGSSFMCAPAGSIVNSAPCRMMPSVR